MNGRNVDNVGDSLVTQPSVSIIIPAYNCAQTLPDAVASVREQGWRELEIIVVDDGSTDETAKVASVLDKGDVRLLSQQNAGPAAARNTGIRAATMEWIAFLDADDIWLPGKLEAQFHLLERFPSARVCVASANIRLSSGESYLQELPEEQVPLLLELLKANLITTPSVMVHRQCLNEVGGFAPELRTGEDWDLWLRLIVRFPTVVVVEPLVTIRKDSIADKCTVEMLEQATLRVLENVFTNKDTLAVLPQLAKYKRTIYAWHYSVITKSYIRRWRFWQGVRSVLQCFRADPRGVKFLFGRSLDVLA
jgi:glycosyltransferase involved in cell wall biosynthesis